MRERLDVQRRIADCFLRSLGLEIPSPRTDLFETGVLDSLAFVELVLSLEREFGLKVRLEQVEIDNFRSVERIAAFLGDVGGAPFGQGAPAAARDRDLDHSAGIRVHAAPDARLDDAEKERTR
jgi:acyl carrier protein